MGATVFIDLTDEQRALRDELREYFAGLLSPGGAPSDAAPSGTAPPTARSSAGWAATAGSASAGRRSTAAAASARSSSRSSSTRRPAPTCRCPRSPCRPSARRCSSTAPRSRRRLPAARSWPASCTSRSATPSRRRAPTWPRCGPRRCATATSTSSTGRRPSPPARHDADYIWLACRTDPTRPRHQGISILIVDTTDPGYSWTPIITCDGAHHVNATYYADVRVPADMRVGEENEGWRLITTQLNHERVMLGPAGRIGALYDRVRAWARRTDVLDEPDVRRALAAIHATSPGQRAAQLAGGVGDRTRRTSPTRRPPRSSPRSGCSASAGCSRRSSAATATRPTRRPPSC